MSWCKETVKCSLISISLGCTKETISNVHKYGGLNVDLRGKTAEHFDNPF